MRIKHNKLKQYCLNILDENGNQWIIELFHAEKINFNLYETINMIFEDQWIVASVEDNDNNYLYDDVITEWEMLED